jgi:hypothetical protein
LLSIFVVFLTYTLFVFKFGQKLQVTETAIPLNRPFDMKIKPEKNGHPFDLRNIVLSIDKDYPAVDEAQSALKITKINQDNPTEIEVIGNIIAQRTKFKSFPFIGISSSIEDYGNVYAQERFQWYGHENDYQFYEVTVNRDTMRRCYDDGWILEYKLDRMGHSIPESFKWVKKGGRVPDHCG